MSISLNVVPSSFDFGELNRQGMEAYNQYVQVYGGILPSATSNPSATGSDLASGALADLAAAPNSFWADYEKSINGMSTPEVSTKASGWDKLAAADKAKTEAAKKLSDDKLMTPAAIVDTLKDGSSSIWSGTDTKGKLTEHEIDQMIADPASAKLSDSQVSALKALKANPDLWSDITGANKDETGRTITLDDVTTYAGQRDVGVSTSTHGEARTTEADKSMTFRSAVEQLQSEFLQGQMKDGDYFDLPQLRAISRGEVAGASPADRAACKYLYKIGKHASETTTYGSAADLFNVLENSKYMGDHDNTMDYNKIDGRISKDDITAFLKKYSESALKTDEASPDYNISYKVTHDKHGSNSSEKGWKSRKDCHYDKNDKLIHDYTARHQTLVDKHISANLPSDEDDAKPIA